MEEQENDSNSSAGRSLNSLFRELFKEVRAIAVQQLSKERVNHTLTPTSLVHEVYIKFCRSGSAQPIAEGPKGFLLQAALAMRRILVDSARRKKASKRGGLRNAVDLHSNMSSVTTNAEQVLAIEEVLVKFEQRYPDLGKLVAMRFFAGLTMLEAAEALQIPLRTAERHWHFARAWLRTELEK